MDSSTRLSKACYTHGGGPTQCEATNGSMSFLPKCDPFLRIPRQSPRIKATKDKLRAPSLKHFEVTLKMLNETMNMCIPTRLTTRDDLPENRHGPMTWDEVEGEGFEVEQRNR